MEKIFNDLTEKIKKYKELSGNSNIEVSNSGANKLEEEIKELRNKISELNVSTEGKSRIEVMKITLNISSIESEITLKEMDLKEVKQKANTDYENKVRKYKESVEATEIELKDFIISSENIIEEAVIGTNKSLLLLKDLEEVKGYCSNIKEVEVKNLEQLKLEEQRIDRDINSLSSVVKENRNYASDYRNSAFNWARKSPTTFWGDYDEDRAEEYRDNMNYASNEAQRYERIADEASVKIIPLKNELEKIKVRKSAVETKLETIGTMIDEMIKEVIKEELKKRSIEIPSFVGVFWSSKIATVTSN